MATRSEAKQALWEASAKDDAARAFIVQFMADYSHDEPGGLVYDSDLAKGVKDIRPKSLKKVK